MLFPIWKCLIISEEKTRKNVWITQKLYQLRYAWNTLKSKTLSQQFSIEIFFVSLQTKLKFVILIERKTFMSCRTASLFLSVEETKEERALINIY